jgi:HlyD family secretion protein
MHRVFKIAITVVLAGLLSLLWLKKPWSPDPIESREPVKPSALLAAPGRVEGRDKTISLGAAADGVVREVFVTDGEKVQKGALLAVIDCEDIRAEIAQAKAQAESERQARVRLLRGHRDEERKAAAQQTEAAKSVLAQAKEHLERVNRLGQGEISRDAMEQAEADFEVAQANFEKASQNEKLTDAEPLPEEVARADADVAAAERNVEFMNQRLEKCDVRAPISGTVLKVMTRAGESYTTLLPHPLFTIADDSVRRVRAEVDERDIGKVKLGQVSSITADAFPGQGFEGHVVEISPGMVPKSVLSDDPTQKIDREVLEVVIELDGNNSPLPVGLRVTAEIGPKMVASSGPAAGSTPTAVSDEESVTKSIPVSTDAATPKTEGFVLQVGAMKNKGNADALAVTLQSKGFPAFIGSGGDDSLYRVQVGPYLEREQAYTIQGQLQSAGLGAIIRHYGTDKKPGQ